MLDPVTYQQKILRRNLWAKQQEFVRAISTHHSVAIKGCHGSGKTYAAAGMIPYELTGNASQIALVVAPTLRQVRTFWSGEIATCIAALPYATPEATATMWRLGPDCYAQGLSSSKGVNAQGFHGKRVLIIADEAIGISQDIWDAIEGIRMAGDVRLVTMCNPTVPAGPIFDSFTKNRAIPGHKCITISAFDTPNLLGLSLESLLALSEEDLDYCPFPALTRRRAVKDLYYRWGPTNPRWQARVLGEFPTQGAWSVFSLEWLERADRQPTEAELKAAKGCYIQVGVDVAAGGDDETAACARVNGIILGRSSWSDADPRGKLANWISQFRREKDYLLGPVVVDTVGVGHGMALHLADCGFDVRSFKAGAKPLDSEQHLNAKAEAYFRLREGYRDNAISHTEPALDEDTKAQLSAIEYRELPRGQIQVEPKEDARKRGVPSPDRAEAEVMAFCRVVPRVQNMRFPSERFRISPI